MAVALQWVSEDLPTLLEKELEELAKKYVFTPKEQAEIPEILEETWKRIIPEGRQEERKRYLPLDRNLRTYLTREVEATLLAWRFYHKNC